MSESTSELLRDGKVEEFKAEADRYARFRQLTSHPPPNTNDAVALYVSMRDRLEEKLAANIPHKKIQPREVPGNSMRLSMAMSGGYFFEKAQRHDRMEALEFLRELKANCTEKVERDARERAALAEKVRRKKSAAQLWTKTRISMGPGGLITKRRTRQTTDVADKVAFFDEYSRLQRKADIRGLDSPSNEALQSYITGCLEHPNILYPEPFLKNDNETKPRDRHQRQRSQILQASLVGNALSNEDDDDENLVDICLSHYGMGDPRARALSQAMVLLSARIRTLDVSHNRLSSRALIDIAKGLCQGNARSLTVFNCSCNSNCMACVESGRVMGALLARAPRLEALTMKSTGLSNRALDTLVKKLLQRENNDEDERGCPRSLRIIDLERNELTDAEALVELILHEAFQVDTLNVAWNRLGDAFAIQIGKVLLAHKTTLNCLDLAHNTIRDDGGEAIAMRLNQSLKTLRISWNRLTSISALAFARALSVRDTSSEQQERPALELLDLDGNPIGREGSSALSDEKLLQKTTVSIRHCCSVDTVLEESENLLPQASSEECDS